MLSSQFEKLLASTVEPAINPGKSLKEIIAAYRHQTDACLVVDGVAPATSPTTRVEKVLAGGVPSEWVLAEGADPDVRLLFIHGGAWIAGTLDGYRHQVEALSRATGMAVLAVDYRLAPENPYPAGLNDCVAAWMWVLDNGPDGAGVAKDVFLAGDSAGGNLTFALMLRLRDVLQRLPKAAAAFSPATDFTGASPSMTERAHLDPAIDPAMVPWLAGLYVTDGTSLEFPYVSPVYGDFTGLPPFLVHAGEREVLHDDGLRLVEKAREAGVDARFKTLPGLIHTTEYWCHYVPEGLTSLNEVGAYLKAHV
jgi:acetyl esterase/lipase